MKEYTVNDAGEALDIYKKIPVGEEVLIHFTKKPTDIIKEIEEMDGEGQIRKCPRCGKAE